MERKYAILKTFHFCAAHRLLNHPGKCKKLHGHNYKVTVSIETNAKDPDTNMVLDFGTVKDELAPMFNDLDHKLILNENDPLLKIEELMAATGRENVVMWSEDPTAESMAEYFTRSIMDWIHMYFEGRQVTVSCKVEETEGNSAVY